jgi:iron complex outermembrane receptor protein
MAQFNRISLVSLVALGIAMPAFAQEPAAGPQDDQDNGRDVVVITANKREETVQDTAIAVTAVTSEMRDELGIRSITDLTNLTPGLSYTAGNERVTLRGIGRNTNNFGAEPGVANYTDGIYQSFAVHRRPRQPLRRPHRSPPWTPGHAVRPQLDRRRAQHRLEAPDG